MNEDWYDPVVFYLNGDNLMQRTPVPWDVNGGGFVTGLDFIIEPHCRECHPLSRRAASAK